MEKLFYLLIFSSLLSSCGAGYSDSIIELGNGYYYLFEGGDLNKIYTSFGGSRNIEKEIITGGVQKLDFNKDYIVLKRKINRNILIDSISNELKAIYLFAYLNENNSKELSQSKFKHRVYLKRDNLIYSSLIEKGYKAKNSVEDHKIIKSIADSIYMNNSTLQKDVKRSNFFYIISKHNNLIYRFDSFENYSNKISELDINLDLK